MELRPVLGHQERHRRTDAARIRTGYSPNRVSARILPVAWEITMTRELPTPIADPRIAMCHTGSPENRYEPSGQPTIRLAISRSRHRCSITNRRPSVFEIVI